MPDHLSTKEWKTVLDKKEHKSVKKTGVSETLDDYAAAVKKQDLGKQMSALERIIEKAGEVKAAQSRFPLIAGFLTETIKAAKAAQQKLAPEVQKIASEGGGDEDSTLAKQLAKVRQLDADNAWNFVLVPGKPSTGLVLSKKEIKKADMEKAFEMKGKRGPFFTGAIFFDAGRFVLDLGPEVPPVPGLAKAAKNAAVLHAEMNIKVVVRGAGRELDGDNDIEPMEEGGGTLGSAPEGTGDRRPVYAGKIEQLQRAIAAFQKTPNAKLPGASDGLYGAIGLLLKQIEDDTALGQSRIDFANQVIGLRHILDEIAAPDTAPPPPASKYPDEAYWQKLAEGIMRLDPAKQMDAWKRYQARGTEVERQFLADKTLEEPERSQVRATIEKALQFGISATNRTNRMNEQGEENPVLSEVFLRLERKYDIIKTTPGLDPTQVRRIEEFFGAFRKSFREGTLNLLDPKILQFEKVLDKVASVALAKRQEQARVQGQTQMHDNLSRALPFLKKASLPVGLVKDPGAIRSEMAGNTNLRLMVETMSRAAKAPDAGSGRDLEAAARTFLRDSRARFDEERKAWKKRQDEQGTDEPYPEPPLSPTEQLGADVLKRAQMMQLAEALEALGAPPWDQGTADRVSELQAQLFFLESAISNGGASHEAPALGEGSKGTSGSWWIERPETGPDGRSQKKTYIFKPAALEDGIIAGVPKGSGAPREVMAKHLDDTMTGAGFGVGVSPTTLAGIDSANLSSRRPEDGPMLGSMQQLAPSDGSLMDHLTGGTLAEFSKTVDKRNFDDIAVFDMIFGNVDRHAGNLLFKTDPETGKNLLVPIDHGTGLIDPDALQGNMSSLLSGRNIMANPKLEQAAQPMGDETLEALDRLDPDEMVRQMKRSRDDLSDRHEQTRGTISDEAIEAMGARVRFLKAAAKEVPVATLFQMLALGAKRIAEARPEDIPDLVQTLAREARALEDSMVAKDQLLDSLESSGVRQSMSAMTEEIKTLGWAWNLASSDIDEWVARNGQLVARILKSRMVNPALQSEIDRMLPEARLADPGIDGRIAGKTPVETYVAVFDAFNAKIVKAPDATVPTEDLMREFDELGGLAEWKLAARVFPVIDIDIEARATTPEAVQQYWAKRVLTLRQWKAFKDRGGTERLLELGGTLPREIKILAAVRMLDEMVASVEASGDVLALDDNQIEEAVVRNYRELSEQATDIANRTRATAELAEVRQQQESAAEAWNGGKQAAAVTLLGRLVRRGLMQLEKERQFDVETDRLIQEMRDTVENGDEAVKQQLAGIIGTLVEQLETSRETCSSVIQGRVMREFRARLEIGRKGEASEYRVLEKALGELDRRTAGHAGYPWHQQLVAKVLDVRQSYFAIFDLSNTASQSQQTAKNIDALDLVKAALAGADMSNLPTAIAEVIAPLPNLVSINGRLDGQDRADRIREALRVPVN